MSAAHSGTTSSGNRINFINKAVEEISAGRIRLAPLVSNRFPLEKYREAYEFIDANRETCMKVLIDLEDGKA